MTEHAYDASPDPTSGEPAAPMEPMEPVSTGDAQVDAALDRMAALEGRDPDQQLEVYEEIHEVLTTVLASGFTPES